MIDDDVFSVLGTAPERQERVMRKALEARRDNWPHHEYLYRSAGDLLLHHGKFYSGRQLPELYAQYKGPTGRCFLNALEACQENPTLRYCEGVYAIGDSHYTPHAWCLDPEGELLEVTLPTDPEAIAGAMRSSGFNVLSLEHWGYWGAVFHPEFVTAYFDQADGVGLLDRPVADALGGNPNTREWRSEWPILRMPYDPDRKEMPDES